MSKLKSRITYPVKFLKLTCIAIIFELVGYLLFGATDKNFYSVELEFIGLAAAVSIVVCLVLALIVPSSMFANSDSQSA